MTDRSGQQLGNYRLIRMLGEGGFAEVYLGEHIHLNTPAAIKLLHTQLTEEDVDHFRNEARTIARLVHPNIVRVFDFGVEGKTPYLVMDYAPNGTLRKRHPRGIPVPLPTIVSYVKQVADALQYAHEEKLIHRDIKPENMLIGRRSEILLSDFGIALIAQSSRYQNTQDVVGTVAYMAPEQIQAHPRPASDQYSFGIVVYEWLSGDRPFHGTFTEIALKHTIVPPPPLRERIPNISPAVEQVVLTALEKDPHRRFGSMKAFATAFEQASQSEQSSFSAPTIIRPPSGSSWQAAPSAAQQSPIIAPASSSSLNTPATAASNTSQPLQPTILQPPGVEPTIAASLSSSAPAGSQPFPWSAPYAPAYQPVAKPKNRLSRGTLIDYLIPASTSRNINLLRNTLLIVGFAVLFTLGYHVFINLHLLHLISVTFFADLLFMMLLLTAAFLGKWRGGLAMLVFLAAGAVGLPVFARLYIWNLYQVLFFANGVGGFNLLTGASAGFWCSLPIAAFVTGLLCERGLDRRFQTSALVVLPAILIYLTIGLIWQGYWLYHSYPSYYSSPFAIVTPNLLPLIIFLLVEAAIVAVLLPVIWKLPFLKRRLNK